MSYLEEFQTQINIRDFSKFLQLWEEYCTSDSVESEEFIQLLKSIKASDFARPFGQLVETAIPLWETIKDPKESYEVLKLLIDLETSNSPALAEISTKAIKSYFGEDSQLNERLRLVGLREKKNFSGALSSYELLRHMKKGNFVYHNGGWGTGEIIDYSPIREQLAVEFENVAGLKHITFNNAFKTLIPLPNEHFLARRFSNPDLLEQQAKEDPLEVLKTLLRDLGPKTAAEIKDLLCELVIPEQDWVKWWQGARAKMKKDTKIESPTSTKAVFKLRSSEVTHGERLQQAIENKSDIEEIIQTSYNFVRDMPNILKKAETRISVMDKLLGLLNHPDLTSSQELEVLIFLDNLFDKKIEGKELNTYIQKIPDIELTIYQMEIVALKKRALVLVKENRPDWLRLFLNFLFTIPQSTLKDYLLKELNQGPARKELEIKLNDLLANPLQSPEIFVWYFQKIIGKDMENLLFGNKEGQCAFFESFLILLSLIEGKPEYRNLAKKMYLILTAKRYSVIRSVIEGTSLDFIQEFLLLVAKCQSMTTHDVKIMHSLAQVVHPSLASAKSSKSSSLDPNVIWTTEAGYFKLQNRAQHIGTIEIVENAREIEAARALGDLRENSEYKFALEKRSRLQGELKMLSDQLKKARMITESDIDPHSVSIGSIVEVSNQKGSTTTYIILGPWDADPENNILSFQSKLASAMIGLKINESFQFRDENWTVINISSFLKK